MVFSITFSFLHLAPKRAMILKSVPERSWKQEEDFSRVVAPTREQFATNWILWGDLLYKFLWCFSPSSLNSRPFASSSIPTVKMVTQYERNLYDPLKSNCNWEFYIIKFRDNKTFVLGEKNFLLRLCHLPFSNENCTWRDNASIIVERNEKHSLAISSQRMLLFSRIELTLVLYCLYHGEIPRKCF